MSDFDELIEKLVAFRNEPDWAQFHKPKVLAAAISIEEAKLQDLFLWMDSDEIDQLVRDPDSFEQIEKEIADVLIYTLLHCDYFDIKPQRAIRRKLQSNKDKYPADASRGSATKHTELPSTDDQ